MERNKLKAHKRTVFGRKVKSLRKQGNIPGNIYGRKIKSSAVYVDKAEFNKIHAKAGESTLIDLDVNGTVHPVLIHNIQTHPVDNSTLHADFYQVDLKEKVTTKVPFVFIGEAGAVKDKIGVLLTLLNEVEVEALPTDLPDKIEVDLTKLAVIGDNITIADLKASDKVKILVESGREIVKIAPLISKEAEKMAAEEAALASAAASEAVQVETEKTPTEVPKSTPPETTPKKG